MTLDKASSVEIAKIAEDRIRGLKSIDRFVDSGHFGEWCYERNSTVELLRELVNQLHKKLGD